MKEPPVYGVDLFGEVIPAPRRGMIADEFLVPPFTVLNAREGFWRDRREAWLSFGIKSEVGRDGSLLFAAQGARAVDYYRVKEGTRDESVEIGTSIFDPVLCELAYRWFSPVRGIVLDPFAGGSVRGIVASMLERSYYGIELRPEQVKANKQQRLDILGERPAYAPTWAEGDACAALQGAPECDFLFTCPPYGNLERYSDDPRDLSTMDYALFLKTYRSIIQRACAKLRRDRFAGIVVGDFRDNAGLYHNFVSDTIAAFRDAGLGLYNEAILVTMVATLSMRIRKQFDASRKMGKSHQNFLVFVKGDGRRAAEQARTE